MQDLNDKVNNGGATAEGQLSASEWNQVPSEIQNVIESLGITLSGADLNQLGKAIAGYAANGSYYTDSGAEDAYVLSVIGSKQAPTAYTDGLEAVFRPDNTNTGASTVNVAGLGVIDIKTSAGVDPAAGDIPAGSLVYLRYDAANLWAELTVVVQDASTTQKGIIEIATQAEVDAGTDTVRAVVPSTLSNAPGVAKAWVNFNGTGSVTIDDEFNVTSITDNAVGDYTVNPTTALSSANYVYSINSGSPECAINVGAKTAAALRITIANSTGGLVDSADIAVVIHANP